MGTCMSSSGCVLAGLPRLPLLCPRFRARQKITYDEFLPALIGHRMEAYPGYDDSVDPRISNEFSTAGYRLGHSMVSADIDFFDDNAFPLFPVGPTFVASGHSS